MKTKTAITPFPRCPALDGYHCQTTSLAKIYRFYGHPLSEEMLLGLGAGLGFIYWRMKGKDDIGAGDAVFVGCRGNNKDFFTDIGRRTGVGITVSATASAKKAGTELMEKLDRREPAMVFGDMAYLPWFDFPPDYHFGGHTFVVCGYDGKDRALASDMDPAAAGLKKGLYAEISLEQLARARGSTFKPFPPHNALLQFDFSRYREPTAVDIREAIRQTANDMLHPPIKNLGVKGIRLTAREIRLWQDYFNDHDLRFNLFNLYVYIEIGGTGGGSFRPMYARFLQEAAAVTGDKRLTPAADAVMECGKMFTEIALLFKEAEKERHLSERIAQASVLYGRIADREEEAFGYLREVTR